MTDKKIAKFVGVTPKTLQNWKRPLTQEKNGEMVKFYPPTGKHQLYRGAKLATHLFSYTEDEDQHFNNLEALSSKADNVFSLLSLIERDDIEENVKKNILNQVKNEVKELKEGFRNIDNLLALNKKE